MVQAQTPFCRIARKKMADSAAEVAQFFGVIASSVNRLAVPPEPLGPKNFLSAL